MSSEIERYRGLSNREMWKTISGISTGREAAHLWMMDSWEVDHGRPGLLSPKNLDRLKTAVQRFPSTESEQYEAWRYCYRLLDYSIMEYRIMALEIARDILKQQAGVWHIYLRSQMEMLFGAMEDTVTVTVEDTGQTDKKSGRQLIEEVLGLLSIFDVNKVILRDPETLEGFRRHVAYWIERLGQLQAYERALRTMGWQSGLPVAEDLERSWQEVAEAVEAYNTLIVSPTGKGYEYLPEELKLPPIDLLAIRIDWNELGYVMERFQLALGDDWWIGPSLSPEARDEDRPELLAGYMEDER